MVINIVLTDPKEQHPWAKYYAKRGIDRPVAVELAPRRVAKRRVSPPKSAPVPAMSADLQAAVQAVTAQTYVPGVTAAPFITAMQKEAVARELKRRVRVRYARFALAAAAVLVAFHFTIAATIFRLPFEEKLQTHLQTLPAALLPFYSSARQPLQADGVVIAQADRINSSTMRYVAAVTLRLRKPLYVPATSNGTFAYRRLQDSLQTARDQEMRFNLFSATQAPELPELPLLLQRTHQAGETIIVRVPFTARRLGWHWRLENPPVELRLANRTIDGDSLDRYAQAPHLVYGEAATLADVRRRVKLANTYVIAVSKAVQRHADVVAGVEAPVLASAPIQPDDGTLPADEGSAVTGGVDPDAPASELPSPRKVEKAATVKLSFGTPRPTMQRTVASGQ